MGGKNVLSFLKEYAPGACQKRDMSYFKGKKVVFDTSQFLHRYGRSKKKGSSNFFTTPQGYDISHIYAILRTTIYNNYDIIPIHVFDGPSPSIKRSTVDERIKKTENAEKELTQLLEKEKTASLTKEENERKLQLRSRSFKLTHDKIQQCRELLDVMGLPNMEAFEEADPQCSMLQRYEQHGVYAVAGEDTDLLAYGCTVVIRDFGSQNMTEINLSIILKELNITYDEFVDIFIFSGVDYFQDKRHMKGITGMGIKKAYEILQIIKNNPDMPTFQDLLSSQIFIKLPGELRKKITEDVSYHNIIRIINYISIFTPLKVPDGYLEKLIEIKDRYTKTSIGKDPKDFKVEWNRPDFDKFKKILREKYQMSESSVESYAFKLQKNYERYTRQIIISGSESYSSFGSCTRKQQRICKLDTNSHHKVQFNSYQHRSEKEIIVNDS